MKLHHLDPFSQNITPINFFGLRGMVKEIPVVLSNIEQRLIGKRNSLSIQPTYINVDNPWI